MAGAEALTVDVLVVGGVASEAAGSAVSPDERLG